MRRGLCVCAALAALLSPAVAAAHTDAGWQLSLSEPAEGTITSPFGRDDYRWHPGLDARGPICTSSCAIATSRWIRRCSWLTESPLHETSGDTHTVTSSAASRTERASSCRSRTRRAAPPARSARRTTRAAVVPAVRPLRLGGARERPRAAMSEQEVKGSSCSSGERGVSTVIAAPLFTNGEFHDTGVPQTVRDVGRLAGVAQLRRDEFNCLGRYSDAKPSECAALLHARRTVPEARRGVEALQQRAACRRRAFGARSAAPRAPATRRAGGLPEDTREPDAKPMRTLG
jgi:hypothetical protein